MFFLMHGYMNKTQMNNGTFVIKLQYDLRVGKGLIDNDTFVIYLVSCLSLEVE